MYGTPLETIDERADGHGGFDEMADCQRACEFFVTDPMQAAAGGTATLRAVRRAAENAGLDTRFEIGGKVDGHFGEKTITWAAGWFDEGTRHAGVHEELRKLFAEAREFVRDDLAMIG